MKSFYKITALSLISSMAFAMCSCSSSNTGDTSTNNEVNATEESQDLDRPTDVGLLETVESTTINPNPTLTPTPTPSPTPSPTPTPMPSLNEKAVRGIVADAMALVYSGLGFESAYRYDVNRDGVADLITSNDINYTCITYSDKKSVRVYIFEPYNSAVTFYSSGKTKRLVIMREKPSVTYSCTFYYSFNKDKLNNDAFEQFNMDGSCEYEVNEKSATSSQYKKVLKSYGKLKKLKKQKKKSIVTKQTNIPSVLLGDAAKYIQNDLIGKKYCKVEYMDINNDGIQDCYFTISKKNSIKNYKSVVVKSFEGFDQDELKDVSVVLLSSKKGVVAKYFTPKECSKYINSQTG